MLKFWFCFLSFFYTVNSSSTEEEKVECWLCREENDSSSLKKAEEIFSCNCNEDHLICKKCILKLIGEKINLKKEKELTEKNKKIKILELIFGYIKDEIKNKNNYDLQNFVKYIIEKKEKIEEEEKKEKEKKECEDIKIGEYKQLNAEEKIVYRAINKEIEKNENIIFYIGDEKEPTEKLKFIKSFLSLLKKFNKNSHFRFTDKIKKSISDNCHKEMEIKEIEKWEEKDVEIEVSCRLDTTELQKKIKKGKVILINCPFCKYGIEKASAFFLKICEEPSSQESSRKLICEEPSSQESSKKLSCIEYCGNICSDCF